MRFVLILSLLIPITSVAQLAITNTTATDNSVSEILGRNNLGVLVVVDKSTLGGGNESDPVYSADPASNIIQLDIDNWNAAFGWGDHSQVGYLTAFTETDNTALSALQDSSAAIRSDFPIDTDTQLSEEEVDAFVSNNGYLTNFTESDPNFTDVNIGAFGYIKTYSETDATALIALADTAAAIRADINNSGGGNSSTFDGYIKQTNSNYAFTIEHESNGNQWRTGIGSNTLDYRFDYNGFGRARIANEDGSYIRVSDSRLKRDVKDLQNITTQLRMLRPVSYKMNNSERTHYGFIAQEVEFVFPELVRNMGDMKGLSYEDVIALLVRTVQEQQIRIEELEKKIK